MTDPTSPAQILRLRFVFLLNALGVSTWFPRIPDVKATLEIDLFWLSVCFLMLPLGTIIGFAYATALIRRFGTRGICLWGNVAFILAFILPATAGNGLALGAALLAAGLCIAPVEVAMNARAGFIEQAAGRRIMSGCHAFWSVGAMSGALLGGAFAQAGVPFLTQQLILSPAIALAAVFAAAPLVRAGAAGAAKPPGFALPAPAILALCLLPMGALMVEGAMMEWSALFLRDHVGLPPFAAAATFSAFAVSMAAARLAGDRLTDRLGERAVLTASALLAGLGMAVFASSGGIVPALPAAVCLGLGIGNIYPIAVSLAAASPHGDSEANIAAVAFAAFTVFLIGPPVIGTLGSLLGLPTALLLLTPVALYPVLIRVAPAPPRQPVKEPAP